MTATLWVSLILGSGGFLGALFTLWTKIRDRRQDKEKKSGEIKLDKASYDEIASLAAKINSEERIETERWWKEQFDAVKVELEEARSELDEAKKWRRKTTRRLKAHQVWDERVHKQNPGVGPPPPLFDEEDLEI